MNLLVQGRESQGDQQEGDSRKKSDSYRTNLRSFFLGQYNKGGFIFSVPTMSYLGWKRKKMEQDLCSPYIKLLTSKRGHTGRTPKLKSKTRIAGIRHCVQKVYKQDLREQFLSASVYQGGVEEDPRNGHAIIKCNSHLSVAYNLGFLLSVAFSFISGFFWFISFNPDTNKYDKNQRQREVE